MVRLTSCKNRNLLSTYLTIFVTFSATSYQLLTEILQNGCGNAYYCYYIVRSSFLALALAEFKILSRKADQESQVYEVRGTRCYLSSFYS